jgi:hypothetical protein
MDQDKTQRHYFIDCCTAEAKAYKRHAQEFSENHVCMGTSVKNMAFYAHVLRMQQNELQLGKGSVWYNYLMNFIASEVQKNPAPIPEARQNLYNSVRNLFDVYGGF